MLSWRNRSWKIRCFRLEMLFQKWWYPISSFAHSVSTDLAIFLVSVYRRVLKVFRVCNFFSQQSGKLANFLMHLCIIKIFSEHGFDSDQILKYFNEIVKLFIPRKVTIMSLINGYIYPFIVFKKKKYQFLVQCSNWRRSWSLSANCKELDAVHIDSSTMVSVNTVQPSVNQLFLCS